MGKPPLLAPTSVNDLPGRKPGTSTKVMSGMLKASQNRTKRAPFTEELISKHPRREKLPRLSFWAIPSSTHNPKAISIEAPTSPLQRMEKGGSHSPGKTGQTREPTWHWPRRAWAWPQSHKLPCWEHSPVQTTRLYLTLKGCCHLRPSLVYPRGTVGEVSFRGWSWSPRSLKSNPGATNYSYVPLGKDFLFLR